MNKEIISVIVPVYNVEKEITKCLDSIKNQTFKDFEVIIIDDGSVDNSKKIIEKYVDSDKRFKYFYKENGGQGSARNMGLKKAKGKYITFVDSDDYVSVNLLEKLYTLILDTKADIALGNILEIKNNKNTSIKIENISDDPIKNYMINNPTPCAKLIKRSLIMENELFFPEIRAYEDLAVVPAYYLYTKKVAYVDEDLYYYIIRSGSTMNQLKYNSKLEAIFLSFDNLNSYFERNSNLNYNDELEYIYIVHLLHASSLRVIDFDEAYDFIGKVNKIMKEKFPKWRKNKYFKKKNFKYKLMCYLIYLKQIKLIRLLKRGH